MSGNPTLSPFLGWNEVHGGSMNRNPSADKKVAGRLDARKGGTQALGANVGKPIAAHEFCKRFPG